MVLYIMSVNQNCTCLLVVRPPVLRVETEREKEVSQQLKEATDTATRLQDELRQAVDREQRRKNTKEDEVIQLRKANDTAAERLKDELRQAAADREQQLQQLQAQLEKKKDEVIQLRKANDTAADREKDEQRWTTEREERDEQLVVQLDETKVQMHYHESK